MAQWGVVGASIPIFNAEVYSKYELSRPQASAPAIIEEPMIVVSPEDLKEKGKPKRRYPPTMMGNTHRITLSWRNHKQSRALGSMASGTPIGGKLGSTLLVIYNGVQTYISKHGIPGKFWIKKSGKADIFFNLEYCTSHQSCNMFIFKK